MLAEYGVAVGGTFQRVLGDGVGSDPGSLMVIGAIGLVAFLFVYFLVR